MEFDQLVERVASTLDEDGWCVVDAALPAALAHSLAHECAASDDFRAAGTGRREDYQRDGAVRSDAIRWLDKNVSPDSGYLALMDDLRAALNSRLYLGLFDYECHYARYAPGAFYRKHVDAFSGSRNRVVSTVLYLNEDWRSEEGGELLIYAPDAERPFDSILPHYNRLVVFLSESFPHEVRPATRVRHSIAGWFRIRS